MKNFITILILLVTASCTKTENNYYEVATTPKNPIIGTWMYEDGRSFTVDSITDQYAYISFPKPIDAPPSVKGPVSLQYDVVSKNDTTFCTYPGIYPCCYFYCKGTKGAAVEYKQVPTQGQYQTIVKKL
jgi:hypothetical protein